MKLFIFLCFLGNILALEPSLGKRESEAILKALSQLKIDKEELSFEKKWARDTVFRLRIVDRLMDHPLKVPEYVDSSAKTLEFLRDNPCGLLYFMAVQMGIPLSKKDTLLIRRRIEKESKRVLKDFKDLKEDLSLPLSFILAGFKVAKTYQERSIKNLKREEIDRLLCIAPVLWSDEDDSTDDYLKGALHREFGKEIDTSFELKQDTLLAWASRLKLKDIAIMSLAVMMGVRMAEKKLKGIKSEEEGVIYLRDTEWGKIIIGGKGDDEYKKDYAVIIDLGGDDIYRKRVGGGIGILSHPFSVLIDLSGNDLYQSNKIFNLGSGLFGVGILIDESGDDTYRTSHYAQGTGIFGTGIIIDKNGDDIYQAGYFAQGSANFGFGILLDFKGNDVYRSYNWAQGMGSVWGYGLLADFSGNDNYYAGGRYIHHPLLPYDYRSFAQGFGMGFRPDASGGIGFLYDGEGNDFYNAEVYAQGTSYWYSLGMLYDKKGNDHYLATEYAQGAGIHLSVGALIDMEGDDEYFSRLGPGQGEGHDLSVGILIDKQGKDSYTISGGQGIGLTNSVGIFIDSDGDDSYLTTEDIGQGIGTQARGFGGVGIFLDLGGKDTYPRKSPGEDMALWTQGSYGSGIDMKRIEKPKEEEKEEEEDLSKKSIEEVFKQASLWEVGEAKLKVRKAREELKKRGMEAVKYICENKLDTKSGLEYRAIKELAEAMPDSILPCLFKAIRDEKVRKRANAIFLLGDIKAKSAVDSLIPLLRDKRYNPRWILYALGRIGDKRAVAYIIPYLKDKREPTRIYAASALSRLKDPISIPPLIESLDDKYFTVRSAAENALVSIGDTSIPWLIEELKRAQGPPLFHILHTLGRIGEKSDSLDRATLIKLKLSLKDFLHHKDPIIRGTAVEALGKLSFKGKREMLKRAEEDEIDPFVLKKYKEALKR